MTALLVVPAVLVLAAYIRRTGREMSAQTLSGDERSTDAQSLDPRGVPARRRGRDARSGRSGIQVQLTGQGVRSGRTLTRRNGQFVWPD